MGTVELIPGCKDLTVEQIDERLDRAVQQNERSERLICVYLVEMADRHGYERFGFANLMDYAAERFDFSDGKTAYLLRLGRKLKHLPHLAEALASGKVGWTKAARVAQVANPENELMWVESALSLSVRELERRIRDGGELTGGRISIWLNQEEMAVWQRTLEVCRRVSGAEIDTAQCIEYICGEFLATYEPLDVREEERGDDEPSEPSENEAPTGDEPNKQAEQAETGAGGGSPEASEVVATLMCPDNDDPPSPVAVPYTKTHRGVLRRDGWRCTYPSCTARMGLHVHHIEFRSRSGSKGKARSNSPGNLTVVCVIHHKMSAVAATLPPGEAAAIG